MSESLESECSALLHSVHLLRAESQRVIHAGFKAGMQTIDYKYLSSIELKASETELKHRRCRLKLAMSKSPCDEKEIRQCKRQIQEAKYALKIWQEQEDKTRGKTKGEARGRLDLVRPPHVADLVRPPHVADPPLMRHA